MLLNRYLPGRTYENAFRSARGIGELNASVHGCLRRTAFNIPLYKSVGTWPQKAYVNSPGRTANFSRTGIAANFSQGVAWRNFYKLENGIGRRIVIDPIIISVNKKDIRGRGPSGKLKVYPVGLGKRSESRRPSTHAIHLRLPNGEGHIIGKIGQNNVTAKEIIVGKQNRRND